jgi:hypothetical protein
VAKRPGRGGRRPGAGAPKGNFNGFKHGLRSKRLAQLGAFLAANPEVSVLAMEMSSRHAARREKAEVAHFRMLAHVLRHGLEIKNKEQALAVKEFLDGLL